MSFFLDPKTRPLADVSLSMCKKFLFRIPTCRFFVDALVHSSGCCCCMARTAGESCGVTRPATVTEVIGDDTSSEIGVVFKDVAAAAALGPLSLR